MSNAAATFPAGFKWGSSTNAQQFEGGATAGGKGVSIADVRTREGFAKRYGFVYVDKDDDLRRYRKDSFAWYQKVIASNGADL